jgi:hypothetical protein
MCEAEHGHRAQWRGLDRFRSFLRFQSRQQSARMFVVKLTNFLNRHFNHAHT